MREKHEIQSRIDHPNVRPEGIEDSATVSRQPVAHSSNFQSPIPRFLKAMRVVMMSGNNMNIVSVGFQRQACIYNETLSSAYPEIGMDKHHSNHSNKDQQKKENFFKSLVDRVDRTT